MLKHYATLLTTPDGGSQGGATSIRQASTGAPLSIQKSTPKHPWGDLQAFIGALPGTRRGISKHPKDRPTDAGHEGR